jgi:hypothetical protein
VALPEYEPAPQPAGFATHAVKAPQLAELVFVK